MKKRFLSIFFIALALLLLVACGEKETKFKVTFNANNGDDNVVVEVIKGETVGKPSEDPTKDGYEFKGWQKDGVNYVFETPVEADFTLVAKWDEVVIPPVEFTVVFKDYDGTVLKTETVVQNANATPPTNPNNKEGHTFDKWDKAYTTVKGDLEVTALYVINTYTVTFKDLDGEVIDTQTVNWNENATPPLDPSREGHLFDKWDKSFDNIKADTTITALYIINEYTVTFLDEDESPIDEVKVDWNTLVTLPATPEKVGYDFVGWFTSEDEAFDELTPITEDLTLVAKWELNAESKLNQVADTLSVLFEDPDNITAGFSLPTKFLYDITGVWTSEFNDIVRLSAPNAEGQVTASVRRPFFEVGHKEVKLSILLTLGTETKERDIDLTVKSLSEDVITGTDFGDLLTKENAGKEIVVSGVALYKPLGTNGYYLSTEDGVVAYVNGQTGMPEADKLFEMTATVDNYFNSLQLKDLSFFEIDGDVDHVVEYDLKTINDIVAFPKPSASNVYGHDTYKFKDVRIVVQGTGNYNTFIVDKDFFGERTENNSIMLYYTSQINELRALEGEIIAEIDLILEGYRTDLNIWYFSYVLPMEDVLKPALTDEVKFAVDRNKLPEFVDYKVAGDIPLPEVGSKYESPIVWSYADEDDPNNAYIDLVEKEVILPESTREEVRLKATVGTGDDKAERVFVIIVGEHTLKTIAEAKALTLGKEIMVKGVVTDLFANNTFALQDDTGAIAIYTNEKLVLGNEYTLIGTRAAYAGLIQLSSIEIVEVNVSNLPEYLSIDDILDDLEELENHMIQRISIEGAKVVSVTVDEEYGNIKVVIEKNDIKLTIAYDSRVAGADVDALNALAVDDIVNYVGNLGWNDGPQLGYGPNTYIGDDWPEVELVELFPRVIDFGSEAKTGYGNVDSDFITEKVFKNSDGLEYTLTVKRGQINVSTSSPHTDKGAFVVLAPINTAQESYFEMDLSDIAGMNEIKFSFAAWSPTAYTKASSLTDSVISLQVWDDVNSTWVTLKNSDNLENILSKLASDAYATVTYQVDGPGKYRILYDAPSAASGNTTQALVFDDIVIDGIDPNQSTEYDFSTLTTDTTYVTSPTTFTLNGVEFERLNANISASGDHKGVVLGIRSKNSWESPYLATTDKISANKVEFIVTNWTNDAHFNLNYADHIYVQISTDGETWVNVKDFKPDWNTANLADNVLTVDNLDGSPVYIRLFVESAGEQTGTYQLRLIVKSFKVW